MVLPPVVGEAPRPGYCDLSGLSSTSSARLSTAWQVAMLRSAAVAVEPLWNGERILEPGVGKIVDDHVFDRLEQFELVALFRHPERHHGLQRRAAGKGTGDLRNGNYRLFRELEALARPLRHPFDDPEAFGAFLDGSKHRSSVSESVHGARGPEGARDA